MRDPSFIQPTGPRVEGGAGPWLHLPGRSPMLDFRSGVMTANMGHAPRRVARAAMKAMRAGLAQAWYSPNPVRDRALAALSDVLPPCYTEALFVVTGSEAVEVACRCARSLMPGAVAHWTGNYHGNSSWVLHNLNGIEGVHFDMEYGEFPKDVGVMVMTPYLAAWSQFMTPGRAESFARWIKNERIVLVDDEIQGGFARTGEWFGFQRYGLEPDIVVGGKAASGLLPVSFVAFHQSLAGVCEEGDYISTHSGNPACLAALVENIRWMREVDAPALARKVGAQVIEWFSHQPFATRPGYELQGNGAVWTILFRSNVKAKKVVDSLTGKVALFDTGLPLIKIAPPLNIKTRELHYGLWLIAEAIKKEL